MSALLETIPYARFLGLVGEQDAKGQLRVTMPFQDRLIGDPLLPALHGGSTAAMLELTAVAQVAVLYPRLRLPRPINVSVVYLRSGRPLDVVAQATINKAGRRVAHVVAQAWQEDPDQPIATLSAHFLMDEDAS